MVSNTEGGGGGGRKIYIFPPYLWIGCFKRFFKVFLQYNVRFEPDPREEWASDDQKRIKRKNLLSIDSWLRPSWVCLTFASFAVFLHFQHANAETVPSNLARADSPILSSRFSIMFQYLLNGFPTQRGRGGYILSASMIQFFFYKRVKQKKTFEIQTWRRTNKDSKLSYCALVAKETCNLCNFLQFSFFPPF